MTAVTSQASAASRTEPPPIGDASPVASGPPDAQTPVMAIRGAKTVAGDFAAVASGRLTLAVLSAASVLITTRILGPAGYGTVALVSIAATLIFTVSTSWTGISVRRYGREDLEISGSMARLTWNRALIGAPFAALSVLTVLALKASGVLSTTFTWALVAIAIGSALIAIVTDHWVCLLETSGRMKVSAAAQVTCQVLYVAILLAIFASGRRADATGVLALALGTSALLAVGLIPALWRAGLAPARVDTSLLRRMLRLSTPMIAFTVSQYVFSSIDLIALRVWRTQADVGVYAVAYQAYTVLSRVAVATTAVLVPLFVSLEMAGRRNLIERYARVNVPQGVFLISAAAGLAIPASSIVVPLLFPPRFAAATHPLALLCVALAFLFAGYLLSPILTLRERTRAIALITAGAAVINVVLDVVMLGVFGMGVVAPAVATTAALVFMFFTFAGSAGHAVDVRIRVPLILFAPILGGLVPTLLLGGFRGAVAGATGAVLLSLVAIVLRPQFTDADAAMVAKLGLPTLVKRQVMRLVTVSARGGRRRA